ncbi:MAG: hypothetical protein CVT73_07155 [Alphaproteobacteria bacterium HGW-Alphaproteobacteria-12]|nr:MAG: hypothetical protein CVT73_07155 [Alphaproteobacteria bacterium HGW-Alphaproteobacteria-12]
MWRLVPNGFAVACAVLGLASLTACAEPRDAAVAPPESRAKAVLDAQYAAEGRQPPMQSAEADRIYDAYLESIGKKSEEKTAGSR